MRTTLLVTNDFPPRTGGIQSYGYELARRLPADRLVVYAPDWPGAREFDAEQPFRVHRHATSLLLPTPGVRRTAARLIDESGATAVWFGAAAPLGVLASSMRQYGIRRTVACTHGHEVGWSMVPGARQALRRIGSTNDVLTFISRYSRGRISAALGPAAALEYLPPGVDTETFRPASGVRRAVRDRLGIGDAPVVVCVSRLVPRKGQDNLIKAWPEVLEHHPTAVLLIVGGGRMLRRLTRDVQRYRLQRNVILTGSVPVDDLPGYYAAADVFAMPCRTRGGGLDVEGLGIVFLEASATELPVVAGNSGGAVEAVLDGRTGDLVDGRDLGQISAACAEFLGNPAKARHFGQAGREWVDSSWTWARSADRLQELLSR